MSACPRCGRPVALARPLCLYCGAELDPALPPRVHEAQDPPAPQTPAKTLLVVCLAGVEPRLLGEALGMTPFDAEQCLRRGGWHLHRIGDPPPIAAEAERIRGLGLAVHTVPEEEVRLAADPGMAVGGRLSGDGLSLRTAHDMRLLRRPDVLLALSGVIRREHQRGPTPRHSVRRALEPSARIHLHLAEPRPLEIDPASFTFDEPRALPGPSWLELISWVDTLAPVDDSFRSVTPALGPAEATEGETLLRRAFVDADRLSGKTEGLPILDNLKQFRFYSGWRGAVARRCRQG